MFEWGGCCLSEIFSLPFFKTNTITDKYTYTVVMTYVLNSKQTREPDYELKMKTSTQAY